jgi:hypothetical protein
MKHFKNRVLKMIIFGCKWKYQEDGEGVHNEELHDMHFSPNSTGIMKLTGIRWQGK